MYILFTTKIKDQSKCRWMRWNMSHVSYVFFNLAWFWEAKALQHMNIDPVVLGLDHQMGPMFGRWNKQPMCQCVVIFCHVPSTWCVVRIGVSCNRSLPRKNARNAMLFRWDLQAYWRVCKLRMHFFHKICAIYVYPMDWDVYQSMNGLNL